MAARAFLAAALAFLPLRGEVLAGRVVADDGYPIPASAEALLDCGGERAGSTALSEDGWFRFETAPARLDCLVRVSAPGYRGALLARRDLPLDARIPAAALHRLGVNDGESVSATHLAAPAEAKSAFQRAVAASSDQDAPDSDLAIRLLEEAVQAYPEYAQAWHELGRLRLGAEDVEGAIEAFASAIGADPWFVSPYEPLILLLRAVGRADRASAACRGLRRINLQLPSDCR